MSRSRALTLLALCATSSLAYVPRQTRNIGGQPHVQTKASYQGCSSAAGCGGLTLENGQVTHQFGNPAAIGLDGAATDGLDPAELHKKFALQAADINSAFAANLPANGPFWWASQDSPFKNAHETYLKWAKNSGIANPAFTSPCGTSACPFGSGFSKDGHSEGGISNNIDIANNPFLNGQFSSAGFTGGAAASGAAFTSGALPEIDITKNPFLNGNIRLPAFAGQQGASNSFQSSFETSSQSGSGASFGGINIASNPFLNGAFAGCSGGKSGSCTQTTQNGVGSVNLGSNPFVNSKPGEVGTLQLPGTAGCGTGTCGFPGQTHSTSGFVQQTSCSGAFCGGTDQQVQQGFPTQSPKQPIPNRPPVQGIPNKPPPSSNLPHAPGTNTFKNNQGTAGELTVSCSGQGYICVDKSLCINGLVNDNGENILQARGGTQCRTSNEVCCKFKAKSSAEIYTGSYQDNGRIESSSLQSTGPSGSGLIHVPGSDSVANSINSGLAHGSESGLIHVQGTSEHTTFGQTSFGQTGFDQQTQQAFPTGNGKPASAVRPPNFNQQQTGVFKDSSSAAQTQEQFFSQPGQKPGIPYLPPEQVPATFAPATTPQPKPTGYLPPAQTPTPYKPSPTPYQPPPTKPTPYQPPAPKPTPYQPPAPKPTPYQPPAPKPTPYQPPAPKPTPYQPPAPKPTPYQPPAPKPTPYQPTQTTRGPQYLPPKEDESPQPSSGSQQIVPGPIPDTEGSLVLDITRNPPSKDSPPPTIPSGCAAALKCTRKEFCSADGVISTTPVVLTKEQEEFRVPLTDCKEPDTGIPGKCCRDPTYTDPWPTNQLGQWVPGAFGDTGAYKGENFRKPNNRPNNGNRGPNNNFGPNPRPAGSINTPIYTPNPNTIKNNNPRAPVAPGTPTNPGNYNGNTKTPANPRFPSNPPNPGFPTNPGNPGIPSNPTNPGFPVNNGKTNLPVNRNPTAPGESYTTGQLQLDSFTNGGSCGVRKGGVKPLGNKSEFEADFGEIPWQAMVLLQTNRSLLCGGVITSADVVVTSAHCVDGLDARNVLIKGGEWKLGIDDEPRPFQIVQVAKITRHPQYVAGNLQYDLAMLHLSEKLRLAQNIAPVCLPTGGVNEEALYQGTRCITTGWGKQVLQVNIPNSIMHSVDMSLIPPQQCQAQISQSYPHLLQQYSSGCICGRPTQPAASVCRVDIGSALACTNGDGSYYLEGVYSWDAGCSSNNQLASFYKFDMAWYEGVVGGTSSSQTQQVYQQYSNTQQYQQPQQSASQTQYNTQYQTSGQSYAVSGQKAFQQAVKGHVHSGPQCQCFEEGKK